MKRWLVVLVAGAVMSCSTPPAATPAPAVAVEVDADPSAAMSMIPRVLADFGWAVDDLDRTSGFVRTAPYEDGDAQIEGRPMSEYFDCGRETFGPKAERYHTIIRVRVLVEEVAGGSVIRPQATGESADGGTQCTSTGALERLVAEKIARALSP